MIKAVIFDMYETLITHFESPIYFGPQMAKDAGISESDFLKLWDSTAASRTIGDTTFEETLENILKKNKCYSQKVLETIVSKRVATKEDCFHHLHPEILPLLCQLKDSGLKIGLISNCFSEEVGPIKRSVLFPYFDAACLSYEQGLQKPDPAIYQRCMDLLMVRACDCLYVGDGGCRELEAASELGMTVVQAVWYLKAGLPQPAKRNPLFRQAEHPFAILNDVKQPV